jgi:hypothetical protein
LPDFSWCMRPGWPDWANFRPIWSMFSLGSYFRITEVSNRFGLLYSVDKLKNKFWQKIGWATFWAIFSLTHLVTLRGPNGKKCTKETQNVPNSHKIS